MKKVLEFKSFEETMIAGKEVAFDPTLQIPDFEKLGHSEAAHVIFSALDLFKGKHKGEMPRAWSAEDALEMLSYAKEIDSTWATDKFDEVS
jgi:hypothetical protein